MRYLDIGILSSGVVDVVDVRAGRIPPWTPLTK